MSQKVVVIYGAATMGQELVQAVATAGCEVILIDHSEEKLNTGLKKVETALDSEIARWGLTSGEKRAIMSRIKGTTDIRESVKGWLVIETLKETLDVKRQLFKELDATCNPATIIASNSATISITEIAAGCKYPERTIAMHFQSPIPKVPLVEISRGLKTSDETFATAVRFAKMINKNVVSVYDCPGFITTRIILPMINQAVKVLEEGTASCEQIDTAMKLGFGLNAGPLALADKIGVDTVVFYLENLYGETFDQSYLPAKLLKKMVRAGYKGVKTSKGFYKYGSDGLRLSASGLRVEQLSQAQHQ
ncbi:MAG: 3-hydroxyacyl-CoA dehydrogenase NAD-binding domain-containing protein [Candidatus Riflebacteria bacterium]|nr:3-hydroxyacyl-CoA dehydrogenase NAD-binding domain-containing protein [Candidatus Riflebacteria bacterium]